MQKSLPEDFEFASENEEQTARLGTLLAAALQPGAVVALVGGLGAGKTRLVQAIAEALGVDRQEVTSPTFVLIQEYDGRLPIFHFDAYRLRDGDQFLELGADELMSGPGVCLIEWADRVADMLPDDILRIEIYVEGPSRRRFRCSAAGAVSLAILRKLESGDIVL